LHSQSRRSLNKQSTRKSSRLPQLRFRATSTVGPNRPGSATVAQSTLPKLLYAARLARPDIVLAINMLSRFLTKWTVYHDRALVRLVSYVHGSKGFSSRGYVGSGPFELGCYTDADFAGCKETARSTSGLWLVLRGKSWEFPLEWWGSKRQTCESQYPRSRACVVSKGTSGISVAVGLFV
jgi:hypothetical protein